MRTQKSPAQAGLGNVYVRHLYRNVYVRHLYRNVYVRHSYRNAHIKKARLAPGFLICVCVSLLRLQAARRLAKV